MKRILGLVLALVMVLSAVSAFAAIPSKSTNNLYKATTDTQNVTVEVTENESAPVVELLTELLANNATIPDELKKNVLGEDSPYTKVEEVLTMKIDGDLAEKNELTVNVGLNFPSEYTGKTVAVLLGKLVDGKIDGWESVEATVKEDGSIDLVLSAKILEWLDGHEFVMMVCD